MREAALLFTIACSIAFGWYLRGAVDTTSVKVVLVETHAVRVDGGCYEAAR